MNILIVGYGSIGKRHARILRPMAETLGIVTAQEAMDYPLFRSLEDALAAERWDYVVLCTITARHASDLAILKQANFTGKVLVEKPVFVSTHEDASPYPFQVYVGYHLRFHKLIDALKEVLQGCRIESARAHVGQHLSLWRPGRDPKETYSAHLSQGGGVMRDLSHELDLAQYLFGEIKEYEGKAERLDDVTVDSEDTATFKLRCSNCDNVIVHMNYLDEVPHREWIIETDKGTIVTDLIRRSLTISEDTRVIACDGDDAYSAMHRAVLDNNNNVCTFGEALEIIKVIESAVFSNQVTTSKTSKSA
ncbi:MAG: Gfo/Idh/MocA family protein [Alphaproteobacteria bacterium]